MMRLQSLSSPQGRSVFPLRRSTPLRYGVALIAVGLALLVTLQIELLTHRTPFALFFAAVMVSAWYGGRGPGLFSVALSVLGSDYFIIPPLYTFRPDKINYLEES